MLTGFSYPLAIDPQTGTLRLSKGAKYIHEQIVSFVETERAERLGLPSYGMKNALFSSVQDVGFIAKDLEIGLQKFIPQAQFRVSGSLNDLGELLLEINWAYQDETQQPLNFVIGNG